ncbi:MAG: hypothetical protein WCS77_05275 [Elusimicrobiaceae bacterium]
MLRTGVYSCASEILTDLTIKNKLKILYLCAGAVLTLFLALKGYDIRPDSYEYIHHFIYRPPAYPLFLDLYSLVFGADYLFFVSLTQIATIMAAAYWCASELKSKFSLPAWQAAPLFAVFIMPLFATHIMDGGIGNAILTEAFAYSVFLVYWGLLARADSSERALVLLTAISATVTLLRPQLVFLWPVTVATVWLYGRKRLAKTAIIFLVCLAASSAGERLYHLSINDIFAKTSVVPQHMAGKLLYFANEDALSRLPQSEREPALAVYRVMAGKKLLAANYPGAGQAIENAADFNDICWGSMADTYFERYCPAGEENAGCYLMLTNFSSRLVYSLAPQFGGKVLKAGIAAMFDAANWLTLLFCAGFAAAVFVIKNRQLAVLFALAAVMLFANCAMAEILSDGVSRFYIYTTSVELELIILTAGMAFSRFRARRK